MRHDIKPFLALVLCGALATSFSTFAMSDDGQAAPATPATPTQEETPAASPAGKPRGERRQRGQGTQAATGTAKADAKIGAAAPAFTLKQRSVQPRPRSRSRPLTEKTGASATRRAKLW
ncbi:MAG: hypothetical protein DWI10_05960 [Planctomycetota bacterium]|nr:MAG: hypothetical protein DWI10_05960 [Planctomycetota bacterium]